MTTALAPSSSKALRKDESTSSALASEPEAISPLISTTAVCGREISALLVPRSIPKYTSADKKTNHAKRIPLRQRRAVRCSTKEAIMRRSKLARSQWGSGTFSGSDEGVSGVFISDILKMDGR